MSKIIIPKNYTPALNLYDTQRAIGTVKRLFADTLCATLNLYRVSAPLFLEASTGLNDDLNGVERKVTFDIKDSGTEAQVVQSLAKWKRMLCGECGRYFQGHSTTRTTIWRCATKLAQQGQKRCRMEPIYEEQIQTLLCKAFAEKFKLGEKMDAEVHEVMQMISKAPIDNARNQALKNLTEKLREIHDFDQMEQEGDFLKRQLSAVNYSIRDVHQHIRDIQAEKEALKVRCEVLGEPRDKEAVTELENRLLNEEEQLEKLEHEAQQQAEQVRYMEDYWKKLEQTHEIREKTLQWLDSLAGGTQMFLDEAVGTYVKAFVLSVTIFSPKHFRIHWFDDTCTEVECDSVFEGYQQPGMIRRKY